MNWIEETIQIFLNVKLEYKQYLTPSKLSIKIEETTDKNGKPANSSDSFQLHIFYRNKEPQKSRNEK